MSTTSDLLNKKVYSLERGISIYVSRFNTVFPALASSTRVLARDLETIANHHFQDQYTPCDIDNTTYDPTAFSLNVHGDRELIAKAYGKKWQDLPSYGFMKIQELVDATLLNYQVFIETVEEQVQEETTAKELFGYATSRAVGQLRGLADAFEKAQHDSKATNRSDKDHYEKKGLATRLKKLALAIKKS
ncbi:hypothetical protein JXC34_00355, partial [Candidatus Woesearchaeota archaeon]|nr:hypothetical protein [Candidatus Woesearchaeota archaeon]